MIVGTVRVVVLPTRIVIRAIMAQPDAKMRAPIVQIVITSVKILLHARFTVTMLQIVSGLL